MCSSLAQLRSKIQYEGRITEEISSSDAYGILWAWKHCNLIIFSLFLKFDIACINTPKSHFTIINIDWSMSRIFEAQNQFVIRFPENIA